MSRTVTTRLPWENRWVQPSVEQLLKPLTAQRSRLLELIMAEVAEYKAVRQQIVWYGPGWNWTIQYPFVNGKEHETDILCYLVPKVENPVVCVPLSDVEISRIPVRRLNKLIREGIRVSRCAVSIHWATWTPTNQSEVGHLIDLLKRKQKLALATEEKAAAK